MKKEKSASLHIFYIGIILFSFYIFGQLYSSWFQLYDDYEIIQGVRSTLNDGVASTLIVWLREDMGATGRFRPFYLIHRIFEIKLFGANPTAWSLYTYSIGIATALIFYKGLHGLVGRPIYAALLALLFVFGGHSSIWWRLGSAETIASLWFALAFCFVTNRLDQRGSYWKALILIFAAMSAMSKESFVLAIPWLAILRFVEFDGGLRAYLVRERWLVVGIGFISLVGMLGILFATNNAIGYAAGYGLKLGNLSRTVNDASINAYLSFAFIGIFLCWLKGCGSRSVIRQAIVLSVMLIPQLLLYMKSGLEERYVFPLIFATITSISISFNKVLPGSSYGYGRATRLMAALTLVFILIIGLVFNVVSQQNQYLTKLLSVKSHIYDASGIFVVATFLIGAKYFPSRTLDNAKLLSIAFMFLVALFLSIAVAATSAYDYRKSSNILKNWLRDISDMNSHQILIAADPIWHYQWGLSANIFMREFYGITPRNLYYQHNPLYLNTAYDLHTGLYYKNRFPETYRKGDDYKLIVIPIGSETQFVAEKGKELQLRSYDRWFVKDFNFVGYVKKSTHPGRSDLAHGGQQ